MKTKLDIREQEDGNYRYFIYIPDEVVDEAKWRQGDSIDIDIPMAGADVVLNRVAK